MDGRGAWDACTLDYTEDDLVGMSRAGFDLSSTSDITSVSYAFPFDREIRLLTRLYLPEAQLLNVANKTPPSANQWVKTGLDAPPPATVSTMTASVTISCATLKPSISGWWVSIRGTPRTCAPTSQETGLLDVEPFPANLSQVQSCGEII